MRSPCGWSGCARWTLLRGSIRSSGCFTRRCRSSDLEDAMVIVRYYEKRWLIEEWHKVLKTGLRVEDRQLKTSERLEAMMGLMSVAAVRLFQLKGEARTAPERPAETGRAPQVRQGAEGGAEARDPRRQLTVGRFFRELAKLGGFLGRRAAMGSRDG